MTYPDTAEKRRAGMARMRAQVLASKLRALAGNLNERTRAALAEDVVIIRAAQVKFGEARS